MRHFGRSNKIAFVVFAALIIGSVAALSLVVLKNVGEKPAYSTASAGSYIYTTSDDVIVLDADAQIQKKWDKNYYIIEDRHSSVNLGKHPMIYDPAARSLVLCGRSYRIEIDGSLAKHEDDITLTDFNTDSLYKLQDRLYVMIGQDINSNDNTINSKGFMRVSLDKMGNAMFSSLTTNSKTISPIVLISGEIYFDVSSELLYSNGLEMNVRKVIGSTNEYTKPPILYEAMGIERPSSSNANTRVPDIEYYTVLAGKGGKGGTGGNGGTGGDGGDGGDGGAGGNGGKGGTGGTGGNGGTGGTGGDGGEAFYSGVYRIDATSVSSSNNSITVEYKAIDPYDNIAFLEFWVTKDGDDEPTVYTLDKLLESYTINNLETGSEYWVEFYCYPYEQDTETKLMGPAEVPVQVPLPADKVKTGTPTASMTTVLLSGTRLVVNLNLYGMQYNDFFSNSETTSIVMLTKGSNKPIEGGSSTWEDYSEFDLSEAAFTENGQDIEFTLHIKDVEGQLQDMYTEKIELVGIYQGYDMSSHHGQQIDVPGLAYSLTIDSIEQ